MAELDWIFARRMERVPTKSGKSNYSAALKFYKSHLLKTRGASPFHLREEWGEMSLLNLRMELMSRLGSGEIVASSHTMVGHFSAIRQVMKEAIDYDLLDIDSVHEVNMGTAERETEAHLAYTPTELARINTAIAHELNYVARVISGYQYQPNGVGRDPRGAPRGQGFRIEQNARWYFEVVMGANAVSAVGSAKKEHASFFQAATNHLGGLHRLYRRWGVSASVDENLMMPILFRLIALTGLNPSSALSLRTDCVRVHPLTQRHVISYSKLRSGGEKQLHVSQLNVRRDVAEEMSVSEEIVGLIQHAVNLTDRIRGRLPEDSELRGLLFIYESTGPRAFGRISSIKVGQTSPWCKRMVRAFGLKADNGKPLLLNLVRLRSTRLTQMAVDGKDLYEIQQAAGHRSAYTTVRYVDRNQLSFAAIREVGAALEGISSALSENSMPAAEEVRPEGVVGQIYRGLVSHCRNPFNPPEIVRRAVDYSNGQGCARFNMCLFCHNVVILKENLPALAAYRQQLVAMNWAELEKVPSADLYRRSLEVLNDIFDPSKSQFSREELESAVELGRTMDLIIDPVPYRALQK